MDGIGEFMWPNGQIYKGQYKSNKKHGDGELHWTNGMVFIGKWNWGMKEGEGIVRSASGD